MGRRIKSLKNGILTTIFFNLTLFSTVQGLQYLGKSLGKLGEFHHGVSGEVFAVDGRTLHIKDFTYDGQGPAAYFWAGSTKSVGNQGFRIRDENNNGDVLRRYRKEGVTLTLPEGKTLRDIKWFSVWCEEFEVNFGDVKIPRNFDFPRPQKLSPLQGVHGISSDNIVVVDAQTLLVPNLSYDGEAPDAKFWTGPGPKPSPQGIRIPDENGKEVPLRRYDRKTVVLTLPGDLTVFDIGHFGIWCEAFTVDFGHIQIPQNLNIPPSLKMLGVSPQKPPSHVPTITQLTPARTSHHLAGGHLEATTYRPQHVHVTNRQHTLVQRRIVPLQQKDKEREIVNHQPQVIQSQIIQQQILQPQIIQPEIIRQKQIIHQSQITPPQLIQQEIIQKIPQQILNQNHFFHQQPQQQLQQQPQQHQILIQQQPIYQISDRIDQYQANIRQPVPYTPFNFVRLNQFGSEENKNDKFHFQNHHFG